MYPQAVVYASVYALDGLKSSKLNGSLYMEMPFEVIPAVFRSVKERDEIELWDNLFATVIETPGHNIDCITLSKSKYLFTGDAFIPNMKVVTKIKGGDKEASKKSYDKILNNISEGTIICPGHGEMTPFKEIVQLQETIIQTG